MQESYNKYKRGSEWRKWDLHLHTPYTHLNSYSSTDNEFIEKLQDENISAVALTNYYMFREEEFDLKKKLEQKGITVFFNLELRSSFTNTDEKCCDIHVIFSDEITKSELENLSVRLTLHVGVHRKMAKDIEPKDFGTATVDFWELHKILNDDTLGLKNKHFIGFLSRGHGNARSSSVYESVYAHSDFLLHSSDSQENLSKDRQFWLQQGRPLFQSSDAHDLNEVGQKFSWIKSDTTFEGLKQVIYEPKERIHLQETKPDYKPDYQLIDFIKLNDPDIWSGEIYFNENLNTIIGGRSTGKSSLLASIANKLGKFETDSPEYNSFIEANSSSVELFWKDGKNQLERDIDYFPQSHMHTLACDSDKRNSLIRGIVSKKDQNNLLEEYNHYISSKKLHLENRVSTLFATQEEVSLITNELSELGDKEGVVNEITKLKTQIDEFNSGLTAEEKRRYEELSSCIADLKDRVSKSEASIDELSSLEGFDLFRQLELPELISDTQLRESVGKEYSQLKYAFRADWKKLLSEKRDLIKSTVSELMVKLDEIREDKVYIKGQKHLTDNQAAKELSKKLKLEQKKLTEINRKLAEKDKKTRLLETIIAEIASTHKEYKDKADELSRQLRFSESDLEVTVVCSFNQARIATILTEQLMQRSNEQKAIVSDFCGDYIETPEKAVTKLLRLALAGNLECKGSNTVQSLTMQVLSGNTYKQDYELTYQNDKFHHMSQGKQSFVVLKLLLEFSDKTCPILIDQPEDSLDNRAIYNELVEYLKDKKKHRQIIIVTHNPNVVVGADSEQIIVANQNDIKFKNSNGIKFEYVSGGIEHSRVKSKKDIPVLYSQGIRQHICEVLEGGNQAFQKREKKYQLVSE